MFQESQYPLATFQRVFNASDNFLEGVKILYTNGTLITVSSEGCQYLGKIDWQDTDSLMPLASGCSMPSGGSCQRVLCNLTKRFDRGLPSSMELDNFFNTPREPKIKNKSIKETDIFKI
jgi:hypothetical protein